MNTLASPNTTATELAARMKIARKLETEARLEFEEGLVGPITDKAYGILLRLEKDGLA